MDVLTPIVRFEEKSFVLMTPQISAISVRSIQDPVGSLAQYRTEVIAALDFALTGY
jgi:toxin CcdB